MAFALHSLLFLCGLSTLLTGVYSLDTVPIPCCPDGWVRFRDRCFIYRDTSLEYSDAEDACNLLNGNLACIRNAEENALVFQLIRDANNGSIIDTWIGLNDGIEEGRFVCVDGINSKFLNFRDGQPDDFEDDEDCAEIDDDGLWNDDMCTDDQPFICAINLH
ncbi:galactose-specific lectin nattectin-like [Syngnathoides biaculeatus]|uniref:galactose-specific lectin nattectin-like n=1 Tax=Syngnathoides biaculeatus TaxID=300417 RepID=UPI002ADDBB4E|nr:galactose-specific lectin nattectin-like [Syngnathoides biaculeatus]